MSARFLTDAERKLSESVFGDTIDYDSVRIAQSKFFFLQPRGVVMAPRGSIHFHPKGSLYCEDFCAGELSDQGLFIHEMTHVWQHQTGVNLLLRRHPFCRYSYTLKPGWPLARYGIEQQAEIVRHYFMLREGQVVPGALGVDSYEQVLPFRGVLDAERAARREAALARIAARRWQPPKDWKFDREEANER